MYFYLDGREAVSRAALHDLLAHGLHLPAYYGRNLDALYDCVSAMREPVTLEIVHAAAMRDALGAYADRLMETLSAAHVKLLIRP